MKINNFFYKTVIGVCCSILAFSGFTMSTASAEESILKANEAYTLDDTTSEDIIYLQELGLAEGDGFYDFLAAIENLPEHFEYYDEENLTDAQIQELSTSLSKDMDIPIAVVNGSLDMKYAFPNEVETLIVPSPGSPGIPKPTDPTIGVMGFSPGAAFACIGALGSLVPYMKILKIKKVLKAAGGAVSVMKEVHVKYKKYRTVNKFSRQNAIRYAVDDLAVKKRLSTGSRQLLRDFFGLSTIAGSCAPLFLYDNKDEKRNYLFDEDIFKSLT